MDENVLLAASNTTSSLQRMTQMMAAELDKSIGNMAALGTNSVVFLLVEITG